MSNLSHSYVCIRCRGAYHHQLSHDPLWPSGVVFGNAGWCDRCLPKLNGALHIEGDASDPLSVARASFAAAAAGFAAERAAVAVQRSAACAAAAERLADQLDGEVGIAGDTDERRRALVTLFDAMKLPERDADKAARHWHQYEKRRVSNKPSERAEAGGRRLRAAEVVVAARVRDVGLDESTFERELTAIDGRERAFRAENADLMDRVEAADFAKPVSVPSRLVGALWAVLPELVAGRRTGALFAAAKYLGMGGLRRPFSTLYVLDGEPRHPALRAECEAFDEG